MKINIILFLLSSNLMLFGQQISGIVFEMDGETPIEFVNIGVVDKNVGTVSDRNGNYELQIPAEFHDDTLRFSSIGYHPYSVKVSDFINLNDGNVRLEQRIYDMEEVIVRPRRLRERTLGITTRNYSIVSIGWMGYGEVGVLMKNSNTAFLKEANINLKIGPHGTIHSRLNIYKAGKNMQLENILTNPIYFSFSKEEVKNDRVTIDLRDQNIVVEGDFLVTFEVVEYSGCRIGLLLIPASLFHRAYFREKSQGRWINYPGISLSVLVDVER